MTEIKVPISVLATIYGEDESALKEVLLTQDEEGNEVLSEGATDYLLSKNAERVKALRGNVKAEVDRKAAKARQDAEEAYKAELEALRSELEAFRNRPAGEEPLADRVKREEETKQAIEALKAEYEARLKEEQGKFQRVHVNARAVKRGMEHFDAMKPILGESPTVAAQRRQDFEDLLRSRDWAEPTENRFVALKDGQPDEDDHANLNTLEKVVESLARPRFEFMKQEAKGNGGNQNTSTGGSTAGVPKTEEEFQRLYAECTTATERIALKDRWDAANNKKSN